MSLRSHARLVLWFALSLALAFPAVARKGKKTSKRSFVPAAESGFLEDYGQLETHPRDELTRLWQSRANVLGDYESFIIDEVKVRLVDEAPSRNSTRKELENLAKQLRAAFTEQLKSNRGYAVVNAPKGRTLRVRLALTDLEPVGKGKRAANTATGAAVGVVIPGASFLIPRFDVGWAAIEMELVDAKSGERIACAMSARVGKRLGGGVFRRYKRWGDARRAFDSWAKQFRVNVDLAHRSR